MEWQMENRKRTASMKKRNERQKKIWKNNARNEKKKYTRVRRVANEVQRGSAGLSANSLNEF